MRKKNTELSAQMRKVVAARWEKTSPEERKAYATKIAKLPRAAKRCFCGATGMLNAANRNFDCCRKAGIITVDFARKREYEQKPTGT